MSALFLRQNQIELLRLITSHKDVCIDLMVITYDLTDTSWYSNYKFAIYNITNWRLDHVYNQYVYYLTYSVKIRSNIDNVWVFEHSQDCDSENDCFRWFKTIWQNR